MSVRLVAWQAPPGATERDVKLIHLTGRTKPWLNRTRAQQALLGRVPPPRKCAFVANNGTYSRSKMMGGAWSAAMAAHLAQLRIEKACYKWVEQEAARDADIAWWACCEAAVGRGCTDEHGGCAVGDWV